MMTELECLPCFFAQVTRTLKSAGIHGDITRRITGKAVAIIENASLDQAPARITTLIHRMLRETTGIDPYRSIKEQYNQIALGMLPDPTFSEQRVELAAGDVLKAVRELRIERRHSRGSGDRARRVRVVRAWESRR